MVETIKVPSQVQCVFCGKMNERKNGNFSINDVSFSIFCSKCGAIQYYNYFGGKKCSGFRISNIEFEKEQRDGSN